MKFRILPVTYRTDMILDENAPYCIAQKNMRKRGESYDSIASVVALMLEFNMSKKLAYALWIYACVAAWVVILFSVLVLTTGCSTSPEFYKAEAERHKSASLPVFECAQCSGVVIRGQIGGGNAPTVAPVNGWNAVIEVAKTAGGVVSQNAGIAGASIIASKGFSALANTKSGDTVTNTSNVTTSAHSEQNTQSSFAADNGGQIAGGDALSQSKNPAVSVTKTQTENSVQDSYNPVSTTTNNGNLGE